MTKQNYAAQTQPEKKNGHKPETTRLARQMGNLAWMAEHSSEFVGTTGMENIQSQALQLNDLGLQTVQLQEIAAHIGKVQGNKHLHCMVHSQKNRAASSTRPNADDQVGLPADTLEQRPEENNKLQRSGEPQKTFAQRFEESEHMKIGNAATEGKHGEAQTVVLASDYRITYGEMVAMADHFESLDQMRIFASNKKRTGAGTREEIEYVRVVKVLKQEDKKDSFSKSASKAGDDRYTKMAFDNAAHFPNPKLGDDQRSASDKAGDVDRKGQPANAEARYSKYHLQALKEAYLCGRNDKSIESALAVEAFGAHYLTDAFSGGHVRTARTSINEYWDARIPMFNFNLKGYVANRMATYLAGHGFTRIYTGDAVYQGSRVTLLGSRSAIAQTTEKIDSIGPLTFGSVVGRAVHDYDNYTGVAATIQGKDVTLFGDSKLGQGDEEQYATQAVKVSYQEVLRAWELGKKHDANGIADLLLQPGPFAAEQLLPQAKPDAEQPDFYDEDAKEWRSRKSINWKTDIKTLLGDDKFKKGFELFITSYKDMIAAVGKSFGGDIGKAFEEVFLKRILDPAQQIKVLQEVIDWVPDTGGGLFGHNQDDNALDYYKQARKQHALRTLTYEQKRKIIKNLLDGATVGEEEDAVVELLEQNKYDARQLIREFGWGRLHDEIDDWAGNDFEDKFPKKEYAR